MLCEKNLKDSIVAINFVVNGYSSASYRCLYGGETSSASWIGLCKLLRVLFDFCWFYFVHYLFLLYSVDHHPLFVYGFWCCWWWKIFAGVPFDAGVFKGSMCGLIFFKIYINGLPDYVVAKISISAVDTTLYPKCYRAFDFWRQLELASELESDLRYTVNWTGSGLLLSVLEKINFDFISYFDYFWCCWCENGSWLMFLLKSNHVGFWDYLFFSCGLRLLDCLYFQSCF